MQKINLKVERGNKLPVKSLKQISEIWKNAFGPIRLPKPNRKWYANHIFFIVYDQNGILSIGTLQTITINFLGKKYNILGIGGIASLIKKKGYGKILMTAMRKYILKKRKTAIGFCSHDNSIFYKKCGFRLAKDLVKQFLYINAKGKLIKNNRDDDIIYLSGTDRFMEKVLYSKEKVLLTRPHW